MPAHVGHPHRWRILAVLVLGLLIIVMDTTILNVTLKTLADPEVGLGASQAELEWMVNSYTLVFGSLLFTWGVVADRWGRRRSLLVGLALFAVSSLGAALSTTPLMLIAARAIMGIGGAALIPATLATLSEVFDDRERPKAFGLWAASVGMALALGPVLGGFLLDHFAWGSVFLINVPIAVVAIAAIRLVVPETRDPNPGSFDPLGVLLSIVGFTLMVYGIITGGDDGFGAPLAYGPILGGLAVLAILGLVERRSRNPALDVELFRDARFSAAVGAITLAFFALMGMSFSLSFYMQSVLDMSPFATGLTFVPLALVQIVAAPASPRLAQRYGAKIVAAVALGLIALALAGLSQLATDTPLRYVILDTMVLGTGMGLLMPAMTTSVMTAVPRDKAGAGSAVSQTLRQIGGAFGVAIIGSVLSASYRAQIGPTIDQIPGLTGQQRGLVSGSIEATLGFVDKVSPMFPQAKALIRPAQEAYVHAAAVANIVSVAVILLALGVVLLWLPGRAIRAEMKPAE
ncbi:MAG TPA: MFS transporter [Hyphomicrobiales bacterium]|nr:MFS transporter [Hyphomicrobiales bacterium]